MSEVMKPCPQCNSPYGYEIKADLYNCPECYFEWQPNALIKPEPYKVFDANGNQLENGDAVIIIKDLPVKGAPKPIKSGTKVKRIRLSEGDHNIDCKIEGFGAMALKSEFVKKA